MFEITLQRYGDFSALTIALSWHFAYQTFGMAALFARFWLLLTPETNNFLNFFVNLQP